jgi:hypothetical protein
MTRAQGEFTMGRFYPESPSIVLENVDRTGMPDSVPRTWILTTRDRTLSVKSQRRSIAAIGGVQTVIPIDTCHDLMISEPNRLAEILVDRVGSIPNARCRLVQTLILAESRRRSSARHCRRVKAAGKCCGTGLSPYHEDLAHARSRALRGIRSSTYPTLIWLRCSTSSTGYSSPAVWFCWRFKLVTSLEY